MLLMIDNYDSFTYNLVQYLGELGAEVLVHRHDAIDVAGIAALHVRLAAAAREIRKHWDNIQSYFHTNIPLVVENEREVTHA